MPATRQIWSRTILLAAYAALLLVQFFCIIGPDNAAFISPSARVLTIKKAHVEKAAPGIDTAEKVRTKLSINKRFYHVAGDIVLPDMQQIAVFNETSFYSIPGRPYTPLSYIITEPLRGPPAFLSLA